MNQALPKRRWFQFSLRTFLIAVVLFGGWIGWNIYEVKQRELFLKFITTHKGTVSEFSNELPEPPWRQNKMPWMWRLLGAEQIRKIEVEVPNISLADAKALAAWFPEADISFYDGNYHNIQ